MIEALLIVLFAVAFGSLVILTRGLLKLPGPYRNTTLDDYFAEMVKQRNQRAAFKAARQRKWRGRIKYPHNRIGRKPYCIDRKSRGRRTYEVVTL